MNTWQRTALLVATIVGGCATTSVFAGRRVEFKQTETWAIGIDAIGVATSLNDRVTINLDRLALTANPIVKGSRTIAVRVCSAEKIRDGGWTFGNCSKYLDDVFLEEGETKEFTNVKTQIPFPRKGSWLVIETTNFSDGRTCYAHSQRDLLANK